MLANTFKLSAMADRDVFRLNFAQIDQKKAKGLPCRFQQCLCLSKGVLKRNLSDI